MTLHSVPFTTSASRRDAEWFLAIVEAAPTAMLVVDERRAIHLVNRSAETLFGYAREELVGKPIESLVPELARAPSSELRWRPHADPIAGVARAGRDALARRKDGTEIPIEIALNAVSTVTETYTLVSVVDLTERRRGEAALRESEARFHAVVEATPTGLVMVGADGQILLVNAQLERLFGYGRAELLGQPVDTLVPARFRGDRPRQRCEFFSLSATRSSGTARDLFGLRKDGTEFPVEIGLNPVEGVEGDAVMASIIDITGRKRVEDELRRSNTELEQFAYVASHDLQEPLRMVASYTQLLGDRYRGKLDDRADKYIHYAVDGAKRMQGLVTDLLGYSRVGTQGKPLVPVSAGHVVSHTLAVMRAPICQANATIEVGVLPLVMADETQLGQLFQNLFSNALKFRSDAPPRVRVSAEYVDERWVFAVEDNGIGVDLQYADRIFQMFHRLHERWKYPGSGMGLAIARRIVERHGGEIWVASGASRGALFRFTLRGAPTEARSP